MHYSSKDTDWATARSGNIWKRSNGIPMIVGKRKDGRWWARRGDDFIKGSFYTEQEAKRAAENGHDGKDASEREDDEWWG